MHKQQAQIKRKIKVDFFITLDYTKDKECWGDFSPHSSYRLRLTFGGFRLAVFLLPLMVCIKVIVAMIFDHTPKATTAISLVSIFFTSLAVIILYHIVHYMSRLF